MQHALINEKRTRNIDPDFKLPTSVPEHLSLPEFWRRVLNAVSIFDPISVFVDFLESDTTTMADVYASFLFARVELSESDALAQTEKKAMDDSLLRQWGRI